MKKTVILSALRELNKELKNKNVRGEICLVGGAVMCLVFNSRDSTKDVDAMMNPSIVIQKAAMNVSETLGLENNFWINDAAKVFFSENADFHEADFSMSNLAILHATEQYMFAMKMLAARSGTNDESDIIFLAKALKIKKAHQALKIIEKYYPKQKLSIETKAILKDIFGD
ncbi:MAG: hypothetical protein ABL927_01495 [Bdellovibrionales bacterium]